MHTLDLSMTNLDFFCAALGKLVVVVSSATCFGAASRPPDPLGEFNLPMKSDSARSRRMSDRSLRL